MNLENNLKDWVSGSPENRDSFPLVGELLKLVEFSNSVFTDRHFDFR
jgi:hypothetical protein